MSTPESILALRRANPRNGAGFAESVEAAARVVRTEVAGAVGVTASPRRSRRRVVGLSAVGVAAAAAIALVAYSTIGSSGVPDARAAFKHAAALTAASARQSGTAVVRISRDGSPWAGTTIRWNGKDFSLDNQLPGQNGRPERLRVVDGAVITIDNGHWFMVGEQRKPYPGGGAPSGDFLSGVREAVGGETLRRITESMSGLTTRTLADGSTQYAGSVPAEVFGSQSESKVGQTIRVLPFGFVVHDDAANPAAPLDTSVTVGPDGIVREIVVDWDTWVFDVTYSDFGATTVQK